MQAISGTDRAIDGMQQAGLALTRAAAVLQGGPGVDLATLYGQDATLTAVLQAAGRLEDALTPAWEQINERIKALGGIGVED